MSDNNHASEAARAVSLALQLVEIECAIYHGASDDQTAHAFIVNLGDDTKRVRGALETMREHAAMQRPDRMAVVLAPGTSTRELSVALALVMNFDRRQAMAAATLAAERM